MRFLSLLLLLLHLHLHLPKTLCSPGSGACIPRVSAQSAHFRIGNEIRPWFAVGRRVRPTCLSGFYRPGSLAIALAAASPGFQNKGLA